MIPDEPKYAMLWHPAEDHATQCEVCSHYCLVKPGKKGICRERENIDGRLISLNYGRLIARHVDPIEKKPLYHFLPGSRSFSIAAPGCNLRCAWCQNWDISQACDGNDPASLPFVEPEEVIRQARQTRSRSIAYTYTEPTIFFEYAWEVSRLARAEGLKNVFVTNGYMSPRMLDLYVPLLDAANVDIKAFDDAVYRKYTGARLQPVLDACKRLREAGVWLEVTTLLVPGVNDDAGQLEGLAEFIAGELGLDTPWHISRYFPQPQFSQIPATPLESLQQAIEFGKKAGLRYIYAGNLHGVTDTLCPMCGEVVLSRWNLDLQENKLVDGRCPVCKTQIAGVWAGD